MRASVVIGAFVALGVAACGGDNAKGMLDDTGESGGGGSSGSGGGGATSGGGEVSGGENGGENGVFNGGGGAVDGGAVSMEAVPCDASFNKAAPALESCAVAIEGHYFVAIAAAFTGVAAWQATLLQFPSLDAVQELNAAGGLKGRCVGVLRCDTKSDGKAAHALFEELETVDTLIGSVGNVSSKYLPESIDAIAKLGKPHFETIGTPALWKDKSRNLLFTAGLATTSMLPVLADGIFELASGTDLTMMLPKASVPHKPLYDIFANRFESRIKQDPGTWKSLTMFWFEGDYSNMSAALGDVWWAVVPNISFYGAAAANQLEPKLIFLANPPQAEELAASELAPYRNKIRTFFDGYGPLGKEYDKYFSANYDIPYHPGMGRAYDSVCMLLAAAEGLEDVSDGLAVRDKLETLFADDGTPGRGCAGAIRAVRDGATTISYRGVGSASRFNEAHEAAGMLLSLGRYTEDLAFEPIGCFDTAKDVAPACP